MRRQAPLILGAGPAGCAAAIALGREGFRPQLVDREREAGDPLCGGFLSWRTAETLASLGVDPASLGAARVDTLALFAHGRSFSCALPRPAFGLSRHALDNALRERAVAHGAELAIDTIRSLEGTTAMGRRREWRSDAVFLASGKHDLRGCARPRSSADPALGLRLRLPATPTRRRLLRGRIELHLFRGGYAGIILQEGGAANVCLALRKSALAAHGGTPAALIASLARASPALAQRLGDAAQAARIETVGAVPYGYVAGAAGPGLFRLGDQAAVIPSLAGEGIAIALASGLLAARHWTDGGPGAAPAYQADLAARANRPVKLASAARKLAETPAGARLALGAARLAPAIVGLIAHATRIDAPASLARPSGPA